MDLDHLSRLKDEQEKALSQTNDKILRLEKYKSDYESLDARLRTLPHRTTYDVMVPFGRLAFMPGKLIHTNEVTVLLGDNWFAERSAKQACEILGRRIKSLDCQICDLNQQHDLLTPRLDFTSNLENVNEEMYEIKEEYNEEEEQEWKARHREKMRKHRKESQKKEEENRSDERLWKRLDELQFNERRNREFTNMTSDSDYKAQVFQDSLHPEYEHKKEEEEEGSNDECTSEEEEEVKHTINFTHSKNASSPPKVFTSPDDIISPSDIFRQFCADQPKSILKAAEAHDAARVKHSVSFGREEQVKETQQPMKEVIKTNAFTGDVREKVIETRNPTSAQSTSEKPVRVSKFKQQRLKQMNS